MFTVNSDRQPNEFSERVVQVLMDLISDIPGTAEGLADDPLARSRTIALAASSKAAVVSGTLSLPPGPAGMLTILPDIIAVWNIQRQMIMDIAAAFGKKASLTREQMIFCLFKHSAGQTVRGLVVKAGKKVLVKRPVLRVIQKIVRRIGMKITQKVAGRFISRWLPVLGAFGVGAYAFKDTYGVAETAIDLYRNELEIEGVPGENSAGDVGGELLLENAAGA